MVVDCIDISHEAVGIHPVSCILSVANTFQEEVAVKVKSNSTELLVEPGLARVAFQGKVDVKLTYIGKTVPPPGALFVRVFMIPKSEFHKLTAKNWTAPDYQPLPYGKVVVNFTRMPKPPIEDKSKEEKRSEEEKSEEEESEDMRIAREHCRLCQPSTSGLGVEWGPWK